MVNRGNMGEARRGGNDDLEGRQSLSASAHSTCVSLLEANAGILSVKPIRLMPLAPAPSLGLVKLPGAVRAVRRPT